MAVSIMKTLLLIPFVLALAGGGVAGSRPSAANSDEGGPTSRPAASNSPAAASKETRMSLTLTSPAFTNNGAIPTEYTCDSKNLSPQLAWTSVPDGTKSLALVVEDPDAPDPNAPKMTWTHWILYNIPPSAAGLAKAVATKDLPAGTLEGM